MTRFGLNARFVHHCTYFTATKPGMIISNVALHEILLVLLLKSDLLRLAPSIPSHQNSRKVLVRAAEDTSFSQDKETRAIDTTPATYIDHPRTRCPSHTCSMNPPSPTAPLLNRLSIPPSSPPL